MAKGVYESRQKDYKNPFRKMVYHSEDQMNAVIGKLEDNQFIQNELKQMEMLKKNIRGIIKKYAKNEKNGPTKSPEK